MDNSYNRIVIRLGIWATSVRGVNLSFLLLMLTLFAILMLSPVYAQTGAYDWEGVPDTFPGIRLAQASISTPRLMKIYCLRIDTDHPEIQFGVTGRWDDWVENSEEVVIKQTRHFLQDSRAAGVNMIAATNAAPWGPWTNICSIPDTLPPGFFAVNVNGLLVSDGTLVSPASGAPSFIVYRDGSVDLSVTTPSTNLENIWTAISGFGFVLTNGVINTGGMDLHPRTGIGICPAGRYVYWLAIDGRQSASEGATTMEVGQWLLYYGAYNGLNMDGGGSTTLVLWNEDGPCGEARLVNTPVGCGSLNSERAVGGNLGVYYTSPLPTDCDECRETTSTYFEVGQDVCFRVPGTLSDTACFRWTKDGSNLTSRVYNDACRNLRLTNVQVEDSGWYECAYDDGTGVLYHREYLQVVSELPAGSHVALAVLILLFLIAFSASRVHCCKL